MEPPSNQTARGHEEPVARQFSVFLPNRIGQLRDLLEQFQEAEVDVLGMSVIDSTDWAVIRILFSDPNKASAVLKKHGHAHTESQILLVEFPTSEMLIDACELLTRVEISVHFAYTLTVRGHGNPIMALHVDDHHLAAQALTRRGYTLLGDEDLADPC
jgi:hypothetical protein